MCIQAGISYFYAVADSYHAKNPGPISPSIPREGAPWIRRRCRAVYISTTSLLSSERHALIQQGNSKMGKVPDDVICMWPKAGRRKQVYISFSMPDGFWYLARSAVSSVFFPSGPLRNKDISNRKGNVETGVHTVHQISYLYDTIDFLKKKEGMRQCNSRLLYPIFLLSGLESRSASVYGHLSSYRWCNRCLFL